MASSVNTSKTMQMNLEKKCIDLEGQLSWKNKALDSATDKLSSAKENVAMVIAEKDKQSTDLISFQQVNEDLKAQLRDFNQKLKDLESQCRAAEAKVAHYESAEYTAKVVDIYWNSPEFEDELYEKSSAFYERGVLTYSVSSINSYQTRH